MGGGNVFQCLLTRNGTHRTFEGFPERGGRRGTGAWKGVKRVKLNLLGIFPEVWFDGVDGLEVSWVPSIVSGPSDASRGWDRTTHLTRDAQRKEGRLGRLVS